MKLRLALALACALLAASPEPPFTARVKTVVDGDTLVVAPAHARDLRVRLFGVDSPEGDQPYGDAAREALAALVKGQDLRIVPVTRDDWSRTVARVFVGEREVNAELVRAGAAWVYRRYTHDEELVALEDEARRAKRGLWALPQAERIPPWQWRQNARAPAHGERACGAKHYCREMTDCAEARWYLTHCDLRSLDGNGDGTPCSGLCRK